MVPYVRLSLFKHYIVEHLKDTEEFESFDFINMAEEEVDEWCHQNTDKYLKEFGLSQNDFYFDSNKLDKKLYKKALFETRKEVYQAVEALFHNLNTLQSRSGNQLKTRWLAA